MSITYCFFLIDIHEGYLSLHDADIKQGNFATELKNLGKAIKNIFKKVFLK